MSHKWEIEVTAGSYYPSLSDHFRGDDISLCHEDDEMGLQFFAYSRHVDGLNGADLVASRLFSLQLLLNGALRTEWNDFNTLPVEFTRFAEATGGGTFPVFAARIEEYPFNQGSEGDPLPNGIDNPKGRRSSYLLYLSKKDKAIRDLLFLIGLVSKNSSVEQILAWATLYRILDSVKHHSKSMKVDYKKYASEKSVKRFTAACNNMSILGLNARHGAAGNSPPTDVMTDLSEAEKLIISMSSDFMKEYVDTKYP